jgi:hypothetical protein
MCLLSALLCHFLSSLPAFNPLYALSIQSSLLSPHLFSLSNPICQIVTTNCSAFLVPFPSTVRAGLHFERVPTGIRPRCSLQQAPFILLPMRAGTWLRSANQALHAVLQRSHYVADRSSFECFADCAAPDNSFQSTVYALPVWRHNLNRLPGAIRRSVEPRPSRRVLHWLCLRPRLQFTD